MDYSFCDVYEIAKLPKRFLCYFFTDAVNSVRLGWETCSSFQLLCCHAFPGTIIQRLTSKLKRQPNLVRNAAFVPIHVGTNNIHTHTPAEIRQLFELLVDQIDFIIYCTKCKDHDQGHSPLLVRF